MWNCFRLHHQRYTIYWQRQTQYHHSDFNHDCKGFDWQLGAALSETHDYRIDTLFISTNKG